MIMPDLMVHKYYIYNNIDWEALSYTIKNFTRFDSLTKIPEKYFTNEYALTYKVPDDSRLELIAYQLWGDSNYWDILMILNGMDMFNQLPTNYDAVLDRVEAKLNEFIERTEKYTPQGHVYTASFLRDKEAEILAEEEELNEKYREIIYIEKSHISDILTDLTSLKADGLSNSELLVFWFFEVI